MGERGIIQGAKILKIQLGVPKECAKGVRDNYFKLRWRECGTMKEGGRGTIKVQIKKRGRGFCPRWQVND